MVRSGRRYAVAAVLVALIVAAPRGALPASAGFSSYYEFLHQRDATAQQQLDSGIEITAAFTGVIHERRVYGSVAEDLSAVPPPDRPTQCVWFVNRDFRAATRVQFAFLETALDVAKIGEVVDRDFLTVRGTFARDVPIETAPSWLGTFEKQCRDLPAEIEADGRLLTYARHTQKQHVTVAATVVEVDYADGTSWKAAGN
jgi:hypothetical protein